MAKRPIFIPNLNKPGVSIKNIEFEWYPGFSINQKQKSITALHSTAKSKYGYTKILEVSSKSLDEIGIKLSAFNLRTKSINKNIEFSVESAFQSSKVFEHGGPYTDLLSKDSKTAKKDPRIRNSGKIKSFRFFNIDFPNYPLTFFYDWLYINTLLKNINSISISVVTQFQAFTDIEFNPEQSINCQAFSIALFTSLYLNKLIHLDKITPKTFINITKDIYKNLELRIE